MAETTLTSIPSTFVAGDKLLFTISLPSFPASEGWTLTYSFRTKEGSEIDIDSTASGSLHLFTVLPAETSTWIAGKYYGFAKISSGTITHTVWKGYLEIEPDLSQQEGNFDTRSHAQKCLDSINAVLEGKAGRDVLSTTIAGQSISRMSFGELISAKAYYENLVASERDNLESASGTGSKRNILVRFGNS